MCHCVFACSSRAEQDVSGPLQNNAQYCDQCFCYICDNLASMVSSLASNLNQTQSHLSRPYVSYSYKWQSVMSPKSKEANVNKSLLTESKSCFFFVTFSC